MAGSQGKGLEHIKNRRTVDRGFHGLFCIAILIFFPVVKGISSDLQQLIGSSAPYDTILLSKRVYKVEELLIDKPVVLIGVDGTVIDGSEVSNTIRITSDDVVISSVKIIGSGFSSYNDYAGIMIENSSGVAIKNTSVENCFFGIYLSNCRRIRVVNNKILSNREGETASGNGIHMWKCDSISVIGNRVSGHRDGIYLEFVTNSLVDSNRSIQNIRYGLHFMFSHNDTYSNNIFEENGAGVAVMYSKHVSLTRTRFLRNRGVSSSGLLLKDITDRWMRYNHFEANTSAGSMEESNRIIVDHNSFYGNGWAMKVQASCSGNMINMNNYMANTFDVTTNGQAMMNNFDNNYWDKYEGYDLNRDNYGDVYHHPVSMYSVIVERMPLAMILYRSMIVTLLDQLEKVAPSITPDALVDKQPSMKPFVYD